MIGNTTGDYSGNSEAASGSHFAFSNLGLVTTKVAHGRRHMSPGWTSVSFGFGLTRVADFTRDYQYSEINTTSSGSLVFVQNANKYGTHTDNISLGDLGYQTY